jgi:hypothetical protein
MVASGVSITPERALVVEFSQPYHIVTQAIAVRVEDAGVSFDELVADARTVVGAQTGTTNAYFAEDAFGRDRLNLYDTFAQAVQALLNGDVRGVVIDEVPADAFARSTPASWSSRSAASARTPSAWCSRSAASWWTPSTRAGDDRGRRHPRRAQGEVVRRRRLTGRRPARSGADRAPVTSHRGPIVPDRHDRRAGRPDRAVAAAKAGPKRRGPRASTLVLLSAVPFAVLFVTTDNYRRALAFILPGYRGDDRRDRRGLPGGGRARPGTGRLDGAARRTDGGGGPGCRAAAGRAPSWRSRGRSRPTC